MIDWFTCNFKRLPSEFYNDGFINYSKKGRAFTTCMNYKMSKDKMSKIQSQKFCADMLQSLCMKSKYIVIKAIRIPVEILGHLMDRFTDMRIIYLLRDPRAVIRSQLTYGVVKKIHILRNSTRYCNRVYRDIISSERIQKEYINRFYGLLYEDLARNPMQKAKEMYKFLNMELTPNIASSIRNMTSAGKSCNTPLCTVVSNSSIYADKWRTQVNFDFVKTVDTACAPLYSLIGLRPIPDEKSLKDFTYSVYGRRDDVDMGDYRFA